MRGSCVCRLATLDYIGLDLRVYRAACVPKLGSVRNSMRQRNLRDTPRMFYGPSGLHSQYFESSRAEQFSQLLGFADKNPLLS